MRLIKLAIWFAALTPLSMAIYLGINNQLGPDPGKALVDTFGLWALRLLLITLLLRPLCDITHKSIFIRVRRLVGLFCWFYATLHFAAAVFYVIGYSWVDLVKAFSEKTYIILGLFAWVLLLPLAVTSNRWSQLRLRRRWVVLHRAVYLIAIFACLHFLWLVRSDYWQPAVYSVLLLLLLAWRLPKWCRGVRFGGSLIAK
ncbi:MAG TPA: protein-methionine-sulfoxide reductase heme-binding subunit MsrQ [Spongiibacteraceae bacterium]|nr:protein-methionine-sulfoxide reductase heme-binding subunit MsrQ [Spongiibacteraceae bacterium]